MVYVFVTNTFAISYCIDFIIPSFNFNVSIVLPIFICQDILQLLNKCCNYYFVCARAQY